VPVLDFTKMRNYIRKSNRGVDQADLEEAAKLVNDDSKSVRYAANQLSIPRTSLTRYLKQLKVAQDRGHPLPVVGYRNGRQVFTDSDEQELAQYILHAGTIYYGLSTTEVRKFAYEYAVANLDLQKIPRAWRETKAAGLDWLYGFLKRHQQLAIRKPQATSLSRATSFNEHNVKNFFHNLRTVLSRHAYTAGDIFNMDETGVTTVHRPKNVIAQRGAKQIGRVTSGERGQNVTLACTVSAVGQALPPFFVFPRVNFKTHFLRGAPIDSAGSANKSGWMTEVTFATYMTHFVKHTRCSVQRPVILILDNHSSHIAINILNFAKENGITILSFPPHTTHKLQPLDRSVFGPFKRHYDAAFDSFMVANPGRPATIYDIPPLVKSAFEKAMTPANITSGFRTTGIMPFNSDIFGPDDFAPSSVSDRPNPNVIDLPLSTSGPGNPPPSINASLSKSGQGDPPPSINASLSTSGQGDPPPSINASLSTSGQGDPPPSINASLSTSGQGDPPPSINASLSTSGQGDPPPSINASLSTSGNGDPLPSINASLSTSGQGEPPPNPPLSTSEQRDPPPSVNLPEVSSHSSILPTNSSSLIDPSCQPSTSRTGHTPPHIVRPHPKAPPRKLETNKRKRGETQIFTDTPVKNRLLALQNQRKVAGKIGMPKFGKGVSAQKDVKIGKARKGDKTMTRKTETKVPTMKKLKLSVEKVPARKKLKLSKFESNSRKPGVANKNDECFYCNEPSAESIDGWIRCDVCLRWAHDACAGVEDDDDDFTCEFCR